MDLLLYFLVILNPFAQVLYLSPLFASLGPRAFAGVHLRASALSFGVFALFLLFGETILTDVFRVRLEALQIFGGIIIGYVAHRTITQGPERTHLFSGDLSKIPPQIALPFMVGPGTLWISILMGRREDIPTLVGIGFLASALFANFLFMVGVRVLFSHLEKQKESLAGKYFAILMRTVALLIGAVSVEMILQGLLGVFPVLSGGPAS